MPLIKAILNDELRSIFDIEYSGFTEFPQSLPEAAIAWAKAHNEYAQTVIPTSTTAEQATSAFEAQINLIEGENGMAQLKNAFVQYAILLAQGMLPTFNGVPPAGPPAIDYIADIGLNGGSSEEIAKQLSDTIDLWMKTGTAINVSSGTTITWN